MTLRNWLRGGSLGFLGVFLITGLTYFNDSLLQGTFLIGNNMPFSVYGTLVLILVANGAVYGVARKLALTGPEVALAMGLTLAACCIPGSGLMRTFPSSIILPHHYAKTKIAWQNSDILSYTPNQMLVDVSGDESGVLLEYIQGRDGKPGDPPWGAWMETLGFWIPLVLLIWFALLGLALVVHRQWSEHEHLPYPLATFVESLLPSDNGEKSSVFRSRSFWGAFTVVFLIYTNNYLVTVTEIPWIQMNLSVDMQTIFRYFGIVSPGRMGALTIYFSVIAFAFFIATHVSFSVGISAFLHAILVTVLVGAGLNINDGGYFAPNPQKFMIFGAFLMTALIVVYIGRDYYKRVVMAAVGAGKGGQKIERHAIIGLWLAVVATIVAIAWITQLGLDWQISTLYILFTLMCFFILSRILAETGLFFVQAYWLPCTILIGALGTQALGTSTMITLLLLSMVLLVDPREAFMPFIVNVLRVSDRKKVKLPAMSGGIMVAVVVGLLFCTWLTVGLHYRYGGPMMDVWATAMVPVMPFDTVIKEHQRLEAQGTREQADAISGFARFGAAKPQETDFSIFFALGMGLVLLCTMARLRWTWWPLHPVAFLIWASMPAYAFAWSFLIGWGIKAAVMKYGGGTVYQKLKPLMFGLIAGELVALLIPSLISILWFVVTGDKLPPFRVMPG